MLWLIIAVLRNHFHGVAYLENDINVEGNQKSSKSLKVPYTRGLYHRDLMCEGNHCVSIALTHPLVSKF